MFVFSAPARFLRHNNLCVVPACPREFAPFVCSIVVLADLLCPTSLRVYPRLCSAYNSTCPPHTISCPSQPTTSSLSIDSPQNTQHTAHHGPGTNHCTSISLRLGRRCLQRAQSQRPQLTTSHVQASPHVTACCLRHPTFAAEPVLHRTLRPNHPTRGLVACQPATRREGGLHSCRAAAQRSILDPRSPATVGASGARCKASPHQQNECRYPESSKQWQWHLSSARRRPSATEAQAG